MVVVHRIHVITLGLLHRVLRIGDLERRSGPEPIAVLGQTKLVSRGVTTGALNSDGPVECFQPQIARLHIGSHLKPARPDFLFRVVFLCSRLRKTEGTAEAGEDRQRDGQVGPEGLPGIGEGKYAVLIADLLGYGVEQRSPAIDKAGRTKAVSGLPTERQAGANRVVELAIGSLGLGVGERLPQQEILDW